MWIGRFFPLVAGLLFPVSLTVAGAPPLSEAAELVNIKTFGARGDGKHDDSSAIQAALNSVDPHHGGGIWVPRGSYRIAHGLLAMIQGTDIECEGLPGVSVGEGQGTTRIISDDGITALTINPGDAPEHQTIGYRIRNCAFRPADGASRGNGVVGQNVEGVILENVTISDYHSGTCLLIDGKSSNAQYWTLTNPNMGDCHVGIKTQGIGPNGLEVFGGYFAGLGPTPRPGSIGVELTSGDTDRFYGTRIQGYETGFYDNTSAGDTELLGPRFEFNNINLRVGSRSRLFKLIGGSFVNSLLAKKDTANVGIEIDAGARDVTLDPSQIEGVREPIRDNSADEVKYPNYSLTQPFEKTGKPVPFTR